MTNALTGYVFHAVLDEQALIDLLGKLFSPSAEAIARSVQDAAFVSFSASNADAFLRDWDDAQVFNHAAELRLRKVKNSYNVLLLTEQNSQLLNFRTLYEQGFTVRNPSEQDTNSFLLWGTQLNEERFWRETRIPRMLEYPGHPVGSNKKPPRLTYWLYCERETIRWIRLRNLKEDRKENKDNA